MRQAVVADVSAWCDTIAMQYDCHSCQS